MSPRRRLPRPIAFTVYLARRFSEDQMMLWAGALSYSTLLAVVPLSAVILAAFSAFPVFDTWSEHIQDFVFRVFVPATGETIQTYINEFAAQASRLSGVGVIFLFVTSLLLVSEIERAFNRIWRVRQQRPLASRLAVYWSALTIGPLLVGGSLAITSYLISLPLIKGATASGAGHELLRLIPFGIVAIAFSLAYIVVPNTTVRWRAAVPGGLLAASLFEAAKYGFAEYVSSVPTYRVIYGALATIPLFLVWIYLSWNVILLGALFTAALQTFRMEAHVKIWDGARELQLLFRLVGHLWQAQREGGGRTFDELQALEPGATDQQLHRLLEGIARRRVASVSSDGQWLLVRDPAETTLLDLYRSGSFTLPESSDAIAAVDGWDECFLRAVAAAEEPLAQRLRVPLKMLYGLSSPAATAAAGSEPEGPEADEGPEVEQEVKDEAPSIVR